MQLRGGQDLISNTGAGRYSNRQLGGEIRGSEERQQEYTANSLAGSWTCCDWPPSVTMKLSMTGDSVSGNPIACATVHKAEVC